LWGNGHWFGHEDPKEMIEINLVARRKAAAQSSLSGINLSKANWKLIIAFAAIYFIVPYYLENTWKEEADAQQQERDKLQKEVSKLSQEITKNKDVKEMLSQFAAQEKKLKSRTDLVNEIIKTKINPEKVLERVARDIPTDVWIDELVIAQDKTITITGQAITYKDIGDFTVRANESKFFGKSLMLKNAASEEIQLKGGKKRVEKFTIAGQIVAFD